MGRNGERANRAKQQHRTIRRACGHLRVRQIAARARLVVHHHALANVFAQLLGNQPRSDVRRATSGKPHHQGDRFLGREILRLGGGVGQRQADRQGGRRDQ